MAKFTKRDKRLLAEALYITLAALKLQKKHKQRAELMDELLHRMMTDPDLADYWQNSDLKVLLEGFIGKLRYVESPSESEAT